MGTWVNLFGEFCPDPFTISCHEYFACENGSKAAVGEELEIWVYFLEIYCSEIYRSEKRRFLENLGEGLAYSGKCWYTPWEYLLRI